MCHDERVAGRTTELTPHVFLPSRKQFLFKNLLVHLHQFINETRYACASHLAILTLNTDVVISLTTEEWMDAIQFLTRVGQKCTDIRQEFILLSDVLGASALVDAINNPPVQGGTESSVLGPFFTEDAPDGTWAGRNSVSFEGSPGTMMAQLRTENRSHPRARATPCSSRAVC